MTDPTPITYTVNGVDGGVSNTATVTVGFCSRCEGRCFCVEHAGHDSHRRYSGQRHGRRYGRSDHRSDNLQSSRQFALCGRTGTHGPWRRTVDSQCHDGAISFVPEAGFNDDPTPITYAVDDHEGNTSAPVTVFVDYVPVATADTAGGFDTNSPATVSVLGNDGGGDIVDPTTVRIISNPAGSTLAPDGRTLTVPGEGQWTVSGTNGTITFTPQAGFTSDPTPVSYQVSDAEGNVSNAAQVTVLYVAEPPVAQDDSLAGAATNNPATVAVLGNDNDPDGTLDPSSVVITSDPAGTTLSPDGRTLTVPGQGQWTVNATNGSITFTPESGFTSESTPITYTVADNDGNVSNVGTVTVDSRCLIPHRRRR